MHNKPIPHTLAIFPITTPDASARTRARLSADVTAGRMLPEVIEVVDTARGTVGAVRLRSARIRETWTQGEPRPEWFPEAPALDHDPTPED